MKSLTRTATQAVAVAAAAGLALLPAGAAFADGESTGTNVDINDAPVAQGYGEIFGPGTSYAGAFTIAMEDGSIVRAFCVEVGVDFDMTDPTIDLTASPAVALRAPGNSALLPQAMWLGNAGTIYDTTTYAPEGATVGTPLTTATYGQFVQAAENAAVQLAIWNVVSDRDISATADPGILARANELIALVEGPDGTKGTADDLRSDLGPYAYTVELDFVESSPDAGSLVVNVEVADSDGTVSPAAGVAVTLSAAGFDLDSATAGVQDSVDVATDAAGAASLANVAKASGATVTATADIELDTGALFTPAPDNGADRQQILTTAGAQIVRSDTAVIAAAPAPTTTSTVPPTVPPTTDAPTVTVPPIVTIPGGDTTTTTALTDLGTTTTTPRPDLGDTTTVPGPTGDDDLPSAGPSAGMLVVVLAAIAGAAGLVLASRRRPDAGES